MKARYERWTFKLPGNKRRTVIVRVLKETADKISGLVVNEEGDEVGGERGRNEVIVGTPDDITRRVRLAFSRMYGVLVPESQS